MREIEQFNRFTFEEKLELITTAGALIGARKQNDQELALFCMGEFFTEVTYSAGKNSIDRIEAFPDNDVRIDGYVVEP